MAGPGIVGHATVGRRLNARQIYRADCLNAFFRSDAPFFVMPGFFEATGFLVPTEAFFRFLDAPVGAATPVLTASFPSAVPMASAAVFRNGIA